jgi:hypothetical protein
MTISLSRRVTLQKLLEQAWQPVEAQARTMLKGAVEGLPQVERDRRVAENTLDVRFLFAYSAGR